MKKKLVSIVVLVAVMAGALMYAVTHSGRGGGGDKIPTDVLVFRKLDSVGDHIPYIISRMIEKGIAPENITFTGVRSPGDVFNNDSQNPDDRLSMDEVLPPPEACSPLCTKWTFLPIVKKDHGWYVESIRSPDADIIAYLPNIAPKLCKMIAGSLGLKTIPKQAKASFDPTKPGPYMPEGGATTIKFQEDFLIRELSNNGTYGCFDNSVGADIPNYSLYYVMRSR